MNRAFGALSLALFLAGCRGEAQVQAPPAPPAVPAEETVRVGTRDLRMEGPFVRGNLAVFVLAGDVKDDREFLTLDQGLPAGSVVVSEKGAASGRDESEVNELVLENRSDRWLFLQAGDVVKGGKQDRVVAQDLLVPPRSPPRPLAAFCVEHGRWAAVRSAGTLQFGMNTGLVNGPDLKLAIQRDADQQKVWREVARFGVDMEAAMAGSGGGGFQRSPTGTYNAVFSQKEIVERRDAYVKDLLDRVLAPGDAVGAVFAVDGNVTGVETYASPGLFRAMARKLVESYALDAALASDPKKEAAPPPAPGAVRAFLSEAAKGAGKDEALENSLRRRVIESSAIMGFEYRLVTEAPEGEVLHASYLRK